eukprot:6211888-Pyramimonas_sp.AAC.1
MGLYAPSSTRPLNVDSADNRIIAGAARAWVEPAVAPGILDSRRGVVQGRSKLASLVDIDEPCCT